MNNNETEEDTTTIASQASTVMSTLGNSGSIIIPTNLSSTTSFPTTISLEISQAVAEAAYDFIIGDLVMCKDTTSEHNGKVGKIVHRELKIGYDVKDKKMLSNIRLSCYYNVDFLPDTDNNFSTQLYNGYIGNVFPSWYNKPAFLEDKLELVFQK